MKSTIQKEKPNAASQHARLDEEKGASKRSGRSALLYTMALMLTPMVMSAAANGKSVFDDAAVWIKGAYDRNATEGLDAADLRHAFSIGTPPVNQGNWGESTNCVRRYEDVPCPYAGTVISNVPCLYFQRVVTEDGKTHPRSFRIAGGISVTNCTGSIVMRIRPDRPIKSSCWICGGLGWQVGFGGGNEDGSLTLRGYCGNWQTANLKVMPGTWLDLAVVPSSNKTTGAGAMTFYAVTNNGAFWSQGMAATGVTTSGVQTNFYIGLHESGYSSWNPVATNGTSQRLQAFIGSIQSMAVWNRRLSEAEVREAFDYPRTDIMRIGEADGTGGEFVKASSGGVPVNSDDWYTMPAALAPGEEVDIAFWLKDCEASFSQILHLTAAPGTSAGAALSVSVNGTTAPNVLQARAGAIKSVFLPGTLFHAGSNTLHLSNISSGAVKFDALALGGSWQMGVEDDSSAEFSSDRARLGYAGDGSLTPYPYKIVDMGATNSVSANFPVEFLRSGYPAKFSVRAYVPGEMSYYDSVERPRWKLLVNGTVKGEGEFSAKCQTLTARLAPGDFRPGTNILSLANENTSARNKNAWFNIDCWRFEVWKHNGMVVSFR